MKNPQEVVCLSFTAVKVFHIKVNISLCRLRLKAGAKAARCILCLTYVKSSLMQEGGDINHRKENELCLVMNLGKNTS